MNEIASIASTIFAVTVIVFGAVIVCGGMYGLMMIFEEACHEWGKK